MTERFFYSFFFILMKFVTIFHSFGTGLFFSKNYGTGKAIQFVGLFEYRYKYCVNEIVSQQKLVTKPMILRIPTDLLLINSLISVCFRRKYSGRIYVSPVAKGLISSRHNDERKRKKKKKERKRNNIASSSLFFSSVMRE
jgi:hypothetical protein